MHRRLAAIAAIVLVAGCGLNARPSNPPVTWGVNVPEPDASAVANQPELARTSDGVTLLPISPTGGIVGVQYGYDMPHCGVRGAIDVDGSFWDPADPNTDQVSYDGANGTFRLVSANDAEFTTPYQEPLRLRRHAGAKTFPYCM